MINYFIGKNVNILTLEYDGLKIRCFSWTQSETPI